MSLLRISVRSFRTSVPRHAVVEISADDFQSKVLESKRPVVVDFYADWCGPCKRLGPMLDEIHNKYKSKVDLYSLNVDDTDAMEIIQKLEISSIPDVRMFHEGSEKANFIGVLPNQELETFFENAAKLSKE